MMKNTNLIGISGKMNSGKDTVGEIIQYLTSGNRDYQIKKFAGKLKEVISLLIGCPVQQLEDREFKDKELGSEWDVYRTTSSYGAHDELNVRPFGAVHESKETLTPRLLLQIAGTSLRNALHPNIWINALFTDYKEDSPYDPRSKTGGMGGSQWIITDVRFPNELEAIKERGGIVIRINRKSAEPTNIFHTHISEGALDGATFDHVIDNDGSMTDLVEKVRRILIEEKII